MDKPVVALGVTAAFAAATALYYYVKNRNTPETPRESQQKNPVSHDVPKQQQQQQGGPRKEDDPEISRPLNLSKPFSIKYDPVRKRFEGVPDEIRQKIYDAGYTDEAVLNNPDLVKDILDNLDINEVSNNTISHPVGFSHNVHVTINELGIQGLPAAIRQAITKRGITDQQIMADPSIVQDLLYSFNLEEVLKDHLPKISKPFGVTHDFSISFDSKTGDVTGVPEEVERAIKNAGHTLQEVIKKPHIIKDLLYNMDYEYVKETAKPQVSKPENVRHDFHLEKDSTGKIIGIPEPIRKACIEKGISEEEVLKNPNIIADILYNFNYNDIRDTSTQAQLH
jgi:stalled ribosome rescue protein Dom34